MQGQPERGSDTTARLRLAALALSLVAVTAACYVLQPLDAHAVRAVVERFGPAAPVAFVLVSGLLGALLVPGPLLAGASGVLFGTAVGFFATLGAALVSTAIALQGGRTLGAQSVEEASGPRATRVAEAVRRRGLVAVIVQRLAPGVPDGPASYAFGAVRVSTAAALIGTVIGSAPRAFAYTAVGDGLASPGSRLAILGVVVIVLTGVAGAVLAARVLRRT